MTDKTNIYTNIAGRLTLPQFQVLGLIIILLGGFLLFKANFLGLIPIAVGLGLFFTVIGIQIDFTKKLKREFIGLFGYKYGKWHKIPAIEYVTIFREAYSQRESVASIDSARKFSKIKISLIVSKTERYDAGIYKDFDQAMPSAKQIARNLDVKLLDYTTKKPKWVDVG